jgi:hypothetical protein
MKEKNKPCENPYYKDGKELKGKQALKEVFIAMLGSIFLAYSWSRGDEFVVIWFLSFLILLWKKEYNRDNK